MRAVATYTFPRRRADELVFAPPTHKVSNQAGERGERWFARALPKPMSLPVRTDGPHRNTWKPRRTYAGRGDGPRTLQSWNNEDATQRALLTTSEHPPVRTLGVRSDHMPLTNLVRFHTVITSDEMPLISL